MAVVATVTALPLSSSPAVDVMLESVKHLVVGFDDVECMLQQNGKIIQAARKLCAIGCIVHSLDTLGLGSQNCSAQLELEEFLRRGQGGWDILQVFCKGNQGRCLFGCLNLCAPASTLIRSVFMSM